MFRKAVISILLITFVNHAVSALFIISLDRHFLNKNFYTGEVAIKISDLIIKSYSERFLETETEADSQDLPITQDQYNALLKEVFSPEFIQTSAQSLLSQLEQFNVTSKLVISLALLKKNAQKIAEKFASDSISQLPPCAKNQTIDSHAQPTCLPPGVDQKKLIQDLQKEIEQNIFSYVPNELNLVRTPELKTQFQLIGTFMTERKIINISLLAFGAFLLVLIGLIAWKPFTHIIKWESLTFALTGITLAVTGVLIDQFNYFLRLLKIPLDPNLLKNSSYFTQFIIKDYYVYGAASLLLGVTIYLLTRLLQPYHTKQE